MRYSLPLLAVLSTSCVVLRLLGNISNTSYLLDVAPDTSSAYPDLVLVACRLSILSLHPCAKRHCVYSVNGFSLRIHTVLTFRFGSQISSQARRHLESSGESGKTIKERRWPFLRETPRTGEGFLRGKVRGYLNPLPSWNGGISAWLFTVNCFVLYSLTAICHVCCDTFSFSVCSFCPPWSTSSGDPLFVLHLLIHLHFHLSVYVLIHLYIQLHIRIRRRDGYHSLRDNALGSDSDSSSSPSPLYTFCSRSCEDDRVREAP